VKIVLCDHVDNLGDRGEIVSVAAGYARNFLLPKRLAMPATPGNLRTLEQQRRVWEGKQSREIEQAQGVADRLAALELRIKKKAGDSGTLYGAVTNSEVAELLEGQGVQIDRRRILMGEPIKSLGTHKVAVKLHRHVTGEIKVEVLSDEDAG
jgi:large subunit ribosomal protein L9